MQKSQERNASCALFPEYGTIILSDVTIAPSLPRLLLHLPLQFTAEIHRNLGRLGY
jgi:hypothetical protein